MPARGPSRSKTDGHVVPTAHSLDEMPTVRNATLYRSYADLAAAQAEGVTIALLSFHARHPVLRSWHLNLYLLEGMRPADNYQALHLTSHRFDEPRCPEMLSTCNQVVTIREAFGAHPLSPCR